MGLLSSPMLACGVTRCTSCVGQISPSDEPTSRTQATPVLADGFSSGANDHARKCTYGPDREAADKAPLAEGTLRRFAEPSCVLDFALVVLRLDD